MSPTKTKISQESQEPQEPKNQEVVTQLADKTSNPIEVKSDEDLQSFLNDLKNNHPEEIASIKLPRTPKLTKSQVDEIVETFSKNIFN